MNIRPRALAPIRQALLLLTLCTLVPLVSHAQSSAFPSNEALRHTTALEDPRLSPDGRQVLYRRVDATADGAQAHLMLIDLPDGTPRTVTRTPSTDAQGDHDAVWAHDGQSILFLAKRAEHTAVYQLPLNGGEARSTVVRVPVLTDESSGPDAIPELLHASASGDPTLPVDVLAFKAGSRSTRIALIARDPQTPGEKWLMEGKADATAVDQSTHRTRLYVLDLTADAGQARLVDLGGACASCDVADFDWSPDESQFVVVLKNPGRADDVVPHSSAWIIEVNGTVSPRRLDAVPPTGAQVSWSSDGSRIAYIAQARFDAPPGYSSLYAINPSDGAVHAWPETDHMPVSRPTWLKDGSILLSSERGLDRPLILYSSNNPAPTEWPLPVASVESWDANEHGIVFVGSQSGRPTALYYAPAFGQPVRPLASAPTVPEQTRTTAARRIEWTHDGRTLQGLLYLPPTSPSDRVPLIVEVHGGPLGAYSDRFDPFVDFLLGQGWAVLRTNPRGSTGRGPAFAAANRNDLGGGDYRDIMSGLDWVIAHAPIDPKRLALIGYSYGGEMAGFVAGRTDRFSAIVSGAPVIDQFSEYGTEDSSWYDRWYFGKPWEHMADAWRQSPLSGVSHAHTPFLLLQGEADITDPLGQSQEMYRALRQMGVPVQLVTYPREDHGPLARGIYGAPSPEPWHGFDARRRIVTFIRQALTRP
jgi:dienelactone hydrolase